MYVSILKTRRNQITVKISTDVLCIYYMYVPFTVFGWTLRIRIKLYAYIYSRNAGQTITKIKNFVYF